MQKTDLTMTMRVACDDRADLAKVQVAVEQYVRDMLYVGVDANPSDPFWITDLQMGSQISDLNP